ncbi:hypothetical protein [Aquimarina sp. MMG016]|uniref:hypothetical protein n=1 Tax=Aquimarina sp. MMG016 TaxID=2822690 RepID=UPI001B3A6DDB|nr:hypothetical protein [Aquimarina sp. MMG016]MBQ4822444.1 hypothetical protein [Aquimarina sp. MMG016]
MKSIIYIITSCTILMLMVSCNQLSKEEQEFDTLMQQVIDVHDEVMPKMGEMSTMIKDLESKIDTTDAGKSYAKAQKGLKDSYDFMMEWMGDFSDKFPYEKKDEKLSPEELASQMKILLEEEIEVKKMRDQVNSSIQHAQELLKQ